MQNQRSPMLPHAGDNARRSVLTIDQTSKKTSNNSIMKLNKTGKSLTDSKASFPPKRPNARNKLSSWRQSSMPNGSPRTFNADSRKLDRNFHAKTTGGGGSGGAKKIASDKEDEDPLYSIKSKVSTDPRTPPPRPNRNTASRFVIAEMENATMQKHIHDMASELSSVNDRLKIVLKECTEHRVQVSKLEEVNKSIAEEKSALESEVMQLHKLVERKGSPEQLKAVEEECAKLEQKNRELEDSIKNLEQKKVSKSTSTLELALRTAKTTIKELESELKQMQTQKEEFQRDFAKYQEQVNDTLKIKDSEIESLMKGGDNESIQLLMGQVEELRHERDTLSKTIQELNHELEEHKTNMSELMTRTTTFEELVSALREALREERDARCRVDRECMTYNKKLKTLQMETTNTIDKLKRALQERDVEMQKLTKKENLCYESSISEDCLINLGGGGERKFDSFSSEKVQMLTQSLLKKQSQIDHLIVDNRKLQMLMEKLEKKFKKDLLMLQNTNALKQMQLSHSPYLSSFVSNVAIRIGKFMNGHPVLKCFTLLYMAALHFWVLAILVNYIPEGTFHFQALQMKKGF